nr:unnamed protein product [Callosobruchus analis]
MYMNKGLCVSKWKDIREVLVISTEFGDEQVTTISKRGIEKGKPRLVVEYNKLAILESLLPPPSKPEKQPLHHLSEYCPKDMNGKAKRRRCKYCWEVTKIRKDTVYFCPQCPSGPGLWLTPCFRNFHEQ